MKSIIKIIHHYDDGTTREFTRAYDHDFNANEFPWAKELEWNKEERLEHEEYMRKVAERLNNIDPSIFPEKLFE